MSTLNPSTRKNIKNLISRVVKDKITNYKRETVSSPFFKAIFSEKTVRLASVMQSFYTSFGMSVYEPMAVMLANGAGFSAKSQHRLLGEIDNNTENLINQIHLALKKGIQANKLTETMKIRNSISPGKAIIDPDSVVDVFIKKPTGEEYYFDITTVKPNLKEFITLKKKLLRWVGLRLSQNNQLKVYSAIAIPYNPYYPKKYKRWTKKALLDKTELFVGEYFWNFVADDDIYMELIKVFEEVGIELKESLKGLIQN